MHENEIGSLILETSIDIHRELGPGLLETVYEVVLYKELLNKELNVKRQVSMPIAFRETVFEEGFKADIIVEDKVIIELKSVETINNAHKKQLLTYLRLADKPLGLLINFNEPLLKDGITRIINTQDRAE